MNTVTYRVEVRARQLPVGWNLELSTGDMVYATSLDTAAEGVRTFLDLHQPDMDHTRVEVSVVFPADTTAPQGEPHYPEPVPVPVAEPASEPVHAAPDNVPPGEPSGLEIMLLLLAARDTGRSFAEATAQVFPWTADLPRPLVPQCHDQLRTALDDAVRHSRFHALEEAAARWRHTAQNPRPVIGEPSFLPGYPVATYRPPTGTVERPRRARTGGGRHRL